MPSDDEDAHNEGENYLVTGSNTFCKFLSQQYGNRHCLSSVDFHRLVIFSGVISSFVSVSVIIYTLSIACHMFTISHSQCLTKQEMGSMLKSTCF